MIENAAKIEKFNQERVICFKQKKKKKPHNWTIKFCQFNKRVSFVENTVSQIERDFHFHVSRKIK